MSYSESSDEDDDEDTVKAGSKRRRRVVKVADESGDEYNPPAEGEDEHLSDMDIDEADLVSEEEPAADDDQDEDEDEDMDEPRPASKKLKAKAGGSSLEKFSSGSTYATAQKKKPVSSTPSTPARTPSKGLFGRPTPNAKSFEKENEERYSWLVDLRDADGNPADHPDYDPRTLYIPKSAWAKFTAFEKQYWEVKSKMWNTVVFFKKGKFYELYENDADIAHGTFDLKLAGGGRANMKLAGVPEMSFEYWAAAFIAKGYKVARVDQVESALAKEMRESSGASKKEDKVIRRELTCVLTGGTLVDDAMLVDEMSTYCMAVKQQETQFAVCFVDTATGAFFITQFEDDTEYSQFETLIAQVRPGEVILEKGVISQRAVKILKHNTSTSTLWNFLKPRAEFWDAETAFEELVRAKYFEAADLDDLSHYPEKLQEICADQDKNSLALSAFGGLCWYLRSLKIDQSVISLGNFSGYDAIQRSKYMVLDGQSLQNLEIFANTFDGGARGTLFQLINRCVTPFGKRQLQIWLCHPLMQERKINARLDAVETIMENGDLQAFLEKKLAAMPDLERLLSRIHAGRLAPKDFVRVIEGYKTVYELIEGLHSRFSFETNGEDPKSRLVHEMLTGMPNLEECLPEWTTAFDWTEASTHNRLIPEPGVETEFDESQAVMKGIEDELQEKLRKYRKEYRSQEICFRDSGKELYLIEVPTKVKGIPKSWQQMAATSKVKRYWSPEVKTLVRSLMEAKERHKLVSEHVQSKLYARFDQYYKHWLGAVKVMASLDCLISMAKTSQSLGFPRCRPEILSEDQQQVVDMKELRHPCFDESKAEFIPNDIQLGGPDHANLNLLTGANAAGKSTVLRMTCVAVILAQIGCHVPAASARLTPIDRIMTRLGANDNIFAGKSTFFVELSETKRMLSEATPRTLVVLDELGRGGSSSDGFAIAESVLHHLATHVGALGFFATHYGTLYSSFQGHPEVAAKQMAILVDDASRQVTFLYRLVDGTSPGSFGMNVAAMCGIESQIIEAAEVAAREYEHTSRMKKLLQLTSSATNSSGNSPSGGETGAGASTAAAAAGTPLPLGVASDFRWAMQQSVPDTDMMLLAPVENPELRLKHALKCLVEMAKVV